MFRLLGRATAFLTFLFSAFFALLQAGVIAFDILMAVTGRLKPLLFVIGDTGESTGVGNVVVTLLVYFVPTAYAAFWFVLGRGLWHLSAPRASV